jgi:hypothetical protein
MAEKLEDWQDMKTAPMDGSDIQIRTFDGFEMLARFEPQGFMTEDGKDCGGWVASVEGEHPECWSGGACWESNEQEVASDHPSAWRPAGRAALAGARHE